MATAAAKHLAKYLEPLTEKQRIYATCRLKGMSRIASATAAGCTNNPNSSAKAFDKSVAVQEVLTKGRELLANEIMFDRRKAHEMLMEAHANAETATEQVVAIREMIKLHGVAAPEVKEIRQQISGTVTHEEVTRLSDADLLRLAKLDDDQVPDVLEGEYELVEDQRDEREDNAS